ncbi:beta carbonic anhydrase 5 [Striga asiatica]|uniref:Beta carbonic anhydrase 5 n=1 Tax=Striga asiatica TaxID=4170 RepID=A0A5A7PEV1_STRAF|nr:beta carbonic anhydrase 5 [Striga asiatica]
MSLDKGTNQEILQHSKAEGKSATDKSLDKGTNQEFQQHSKVEGKRAKPTKDPVKETEQEQIQCLDTVGKEVKGTNNPRGENMQDLGQDNEADEQAFQLVSKKKKSANQPNILSQPGLKIASMKMKDIIYN